MSGDTILTKDQVALLSLRLKRLEQALKAIELDLLNDNSLRVSALKIEIEKVLALLEQSKTARLKNLHLVS